MSTRSIIRLTLVSLLICMAAVSSTAASEMLFPQGEICVGLSRGVSIDTINNQYSTTVRHYLPLHDLYLLDAPATDLPGLCQEIANLPYVNFCHPNYLVDPMRGVQSSLPFPDERAAEEKFLDQPAADLLHLDAAHLISTGSGQMIGVIDGGVNLDHPAFGGTVVSGWDYVDHDADASEVPGGINSGHGTFVAGVIHLTVPDAMIKSYRVCDTEGEADGFVVAEAILQALADGCDVINVSLSTYEVHQAIAKACQVAREQNVVVVCAAGNEYSEVGHYPGSDINTLSVAAIDTGLTLADYSSYGQHITLVAPGTDIYAPYLDEGYAWWSGTSFAAPFVAAEIAMLRSLDPSMPWADLEHLLVGSAIGLDQVNSTYTGLIGAGIINPYGALLNYTGECGDLDGDLILTVNDVAELIDGLYLAGDTSLSQAVTELDGHARATNNDLAVSIVSLFTSLSPGYCNGLFDVSFPLSADTISIVAAQIPAHAGECTVSVSAKLTSPAHGVVAAVSYALPDEPIQLTSVEFLSQNEYQCFLIEDSAQQKLALAEFSFFADKSGPVSHDMARLTFSVLPADTVREMTFAPTSISYGDITHTSVISHLDAAGQHIEGWAPQIVVNNEILEVDSYGHRCLGIYRGDVNMDSDLEVDIVDVSILVDHLFGDAAKEIAIGEADVYPYPHPDGVIDITDLQALIDHLYISFAPLPTCFD